MGAMAGTSKRGPSVPSRVRKHRGKRNTARDCTQDDAARQRHAHPGGLPAEVKLLSANFRLYFCGPKTSRNATLRSSSARAQSPVKLDPCMMASVLGFRSASFFKLRAVSGV